MCQERRCRFLRVVQWMDQEARATETIYHTQRHCSGTHSAIASPNMSKFIVKVYLNGLLCDDTDPREKPANVMRRERSRIKRYKPRYGKNRHPRFLLQIRRNYNCRVTDIMFPAVSAQNHVTHVTDGSSRDVTRTDVTLLYNRRSQTRPCRSPPRLDTTPPRMTLAQFPSPHSTVTRRRAVCTTVTIL